MIDSQAGLQRFRDGVESRLPGILEELLACAPHRGGEGPAPAQAGIYLFSEGDTHRYVGRSRNLHARWGQHTQPGRKHNAAAFAFNIAKRDARTAGIDVVVKRANLAALSEFDALFLAAKARVRAMDFRYALVESPALAAVAEVFVAVVLGTEGDYNLFETT